jgi:hypothetical protein
MLDTLPEDILIEYTRLDLQESVDITEFTKLSERDNLDETRLLKLLMLPMELTFE